VTGFEYLHVMIDDRTRLAYAELLGDLTAACAVAFLRRAVAWFADRGVRIQALMSDNGSATSRTPTPPHSQNSGFGTSASAPAGRAPTAKQNA
jgi:hypothetical protein